MRIVLREICSQKSVGLKQVVFHFQSKDLQLDIIPASAPGSEVKLRDAAHELNEEKRKSARRKEYVLFTVTL